MQQAVEPLASSERSVGRTLQRRWWLIALLVVGAVVVALIASQLAPPRFRSTERLQAIVSDQQEVTLYTRLQTPPLIDQLGIIQTDFSDMLRSSLIAWQTIDDLNLDMSARELLANLDVSIAGEFMTVSYTGTEPEQTQAILRQQVDNAIAYYDTVRSRSTKIAGAFLQNELDEQRQAAQAAQAALVAFQLEHNVGDLPREINAVQDVVRGLEAERDAALVEATRVEAAAKRWRSQADDAQAQAAATAQRLAELQAAGDASTTELEALQQTLAAQTALANEYRTTALTLEATAAGQRAAAAQRDTLISQRATDLAQLIALSSDYQALAAAVENAAADFDFLRAKAVEARLKERQSAAVGSILVADPASLPDSAGGPGALQLAALAALVAAVVGVALVLLLELARPATTPPRHARPRG